MGLDVRLVRLDWHFGDRRPFEGFNWSDHRKHVEQNRSKSGNAEEWTMSSRIACDDRVMPFPVHSPDFFLGIEAHVHPPALSVTASAVRRQTGVAAPW